jgi:hypothetical protein
MKFQILLSIILISSFAFASQPGYNLDVCQMDMPPKLDGQFHSGEWDAATQFTVAGIPAYVMHDNCDLSGNPNLCKFMLLM